MSVGVSFGPRHLESPGSRGDRPIEAPSGRESAKGGLGDTLRVSGATGSAGDVGEDEDGRAGVVVCICGCSYSR